MKFLIVGDLHGAMPKIRFKDFDAIIAPGDFCSSDAIRPLMFKAIREGTSWWSYVGKQEARKLLNESLKDGRKVLEFLNSFDVPVYLIPGNADRTGDPGSEWELMRKNHFPNILKGLKNIVNCEYKLYDLGEYMLIGYGRNSGPEYPPTKKIENHYEKKVVDSRRKEFQREFKMLDSLFKKTKKPTIFLSHNMPYGTKFDKISWKKSPRYGEHVGSLITRDLIRQHQPKITIGGHMHEYFGKIKMGRTTVINAGFGADVNTLLELTPNGRIKQLVFKGKTGI